MILILILDIGILIYWIGILVIGIAAKCLYFYLEVLTSNELCVEHIMQMFTEEMV